MISHTEFTHNHQSHSVTGKLLFFLMMGFEPCLLPIVTSDPCLSAVEDHLKSLATAQDEALTTHDLTHQVMKSHFHRKLSPFTKGDKVWLEARNLKHLVF